MKKFGLIGGTSWNSTVDYYALINKLINDHHGDNTNPPLRVVSLNQKAIHDLQRSDDWDAIADIAGAAALELQGIGVEGIALCSNTQHKVFDPLQASLSVPVLHIADAIAANLDALGFETVGLIGTRFTMTEDFIKGRLQDRYQVKTVVPTDAEQGDIQDLVYKELSVGVFSDSTRAIFLQVIESLSAKGAQAVILGCTEFPILLRGADCPVPLIDTVACHCEAITRFILDEERPAHGVDRRA
ncbi:amino acid racemase [Hydrogenophaga sp. PAMC20947]|uniref:aspartate/glutamate racemase family protein n=1 Tax=Hydrogenophaga sp. PAMC20947 TaxID=2565558 RepID=UPI00109DF753|nr:amino acid racemase [Hydrogenophaga sp. PAMC20947]QCB47282.1 amino acid racemase [Hydrogenophaga sp. PAMC20947]